MTTIKDLARRAGVSVATVSAVINRNKFVSPELIQRVEQAIDEVGYSPNLVARSLKSGRTKTLGVLLPNIRDVYWAEIVASIEDVARSEGYSILLFDTAEDPETERDSLRILKAMKVDGLIVVPTGEHALPLLASFVSSGVAVVLLARKLQGLDVDSVSSDNESAGYLGTRHLVELGHRRIAILAYPVHASPGVDRVLGYQRALSEAGIPVDPALIRHGRPPLQESGFAETQELLQLPEGRPEAILVCNHLMTVGMLDCLKQNGLRAPEDVAFVGFDDYPWTPFMNPPITVVQQLRHDIGVIAAHRLTARVKREIEGPGEAITIPTNLILRESCGRLLKTAAIDGGTEMGNRSPPLTSSPSPNLV